MDELLLCMPVVSNTTRSNGNHVHGGQPPNPRSFPHCANGHVLVRGVAAQRNPRRDTEAKAPLATPAAPVALRQSRILRTMPNSRFEPAQYQSLSAESSEIQFCSVSSV